MESIAADVTRAQRLQILVNPFANDAGAASGPYRLTLTCTAAAEPPLPVDPEDPGEDPVVPTDPAPVDPDDGKDPVDPIAPGDDGDDGDVDVDLPAGPRAAPLAAGGCDSGTASPLWPGLALLLLRRRRRH